MEVTRISPADAVAGGLKAVLEEPNTREASAKIRYFSDTVVISPGASGGVLSSLNPFLVSLHSSSVPVYSWSAFWNQRIRMHDSSVDSAEWLFEKDFQMARSSIYWHVKRLMDVVIAATALLLCLPVLLVTALVVFFESRGGVIFTQQRVGFRGASFTIYKFRTMTAGSDAHGTTTAKNDPRVTRVGAALRKLRIDEIPQLLNVLKGDMSIVGPRPEWSVCVSEYESALPGYHLRHLVKPGITGWAQVNYPYGQNVDDARKKLAFDLFYVSHSSLVLDCSIILKTLYVLVGRVGGY